MRITAPLGDDPMGARRIAMFPALVLTSMVKSRRGCCSAATSTIKFSDYGQHHIALDLKRARRTWRSAGANRSIDRPLCGIGDRLLVAVDAIGIVDKDFRSQSRRRRG